MVMENTAWQPHTTSTTAGAKGAGSTKAKAPCPDNDPANSRFYLVIVQTQRLCDGVLNLGCNLRVSNNGAHDLSLSRICRPPLLPQD